jgi:thiol:disulfide interchange protein DsbD
MEPGWHTYWRNPGDSGLPTRVRWTLPEGFVAGEIRWPYPVRFVSGPVVSYGYTGEVLLPVEIRVPATATGSEAHLLARVEWLECQEACLPGKAELSLTLPVRAGARPSRAAAAFGEARRRLPRPLFGWRVSAAPQADSVVLSLTPPRGGELASAQFFPITPRLLDYAAPQRLERVGQGYRLRLARDPNGAAAERVAGVLLVEDVGGKHAFELDVPLAR